MTKIPQISIRKIPKNPNKSGKVSKIIFPQNIAKIKYKKSSGARNELSEDHEKADTVFKSIQKENKSFKDIIYRGTNMIFFKFDNEEKAEIFRKNLE